MASLKIPGTPPPFLQLSVVEVIAYSGNLDHEGLWLCCLPGVGTSGCSAWVCSHTTLTTQLSSFPESRMKLQPPLEAILLDTSPREDNLQEDSLQEDIHRRTPRAASPGARFGHLMSLMLHEASETVRRMVPTASRQVFVVHASVLHFATLLHRGFGLARIVESCSQDKGPASLHCFTIPPTSTSHLPWLCMTMWASAVSASPEAELAAAYRRISLL